MKNYCKNIEKIKNELRKNLIGKTITNIIFSTRDNDYILEFNDGTHIEVLQSIINNTVLQTYAIQSIPCTYESLINYKGVMVNEGED